MACFKPLLGYKGPDGGIVFVRANSAQGELMQVPCQKCIGCSMAYAKTWALRCTHEAQMHEHNSFITLTYNDKNLPPGNTLEPEHWTLFLKRLRKSIHPIQIRFYMCGEYGSLNGRPHYHALIFGYNFPDKIFKTKRNDIPVFSSTHLDTVWGNGFTEIGNVSYASAGYVARYVVKKQEAYLEEIPHLDRETGLLKTPEYVRMSNRPGIGLTWFEKYTSDCFPADFCIDPNGIQTPVPKYYRDQLKKSDPELAEKLAQARVEIAKNNPNNTHQRLDIRERCLKAKTEKLIREL